MNFGDFKSIRYDDKSQSFNFVTEEDTVYTIGCSDLFNMFEYNPSTPNIINCESPVLSSAMVKTRNRLVCFIYELLIYHLTVSTIDKIIVKLSEVGDEIILSNGWIARHAEDVARYLMGDVDVDLLSVGGSNVRDYK